MPRKRSGKEAKGDDFSTKRIDPKPFDPLSSGHQSFEELDEKKGKKIVGEIEEKFWDSLKVINEEILQLSEFLIEDKKLAQELCKLAKPIFKQLKLSFTIPAKAIPLFEQTNQIILNEDGHLIFIHGENKIDSRALDDYSPEIVLLVFLHVIPKLGKVLRLYRRKVGRRVNFFERIYRELENANRAFTASNNDFNEVLRESAEIDGVKKTLFSGRSREEKPASSSES